jgi:hypothetical protein
MKHGQTNRNIFQDIEPPPHAPKENSRSHNSRHSSLGRPTASREVEMVEAASSKRQSNGDTYNNPRKKSLTYQGSSSQQEKHPSSELWLGFPTMEEIAKLAGNKPIEQKCPRTNEQLGRHRKKPWSSPWLESHFLECHEELGLTPEAMTSRVTNTI